MYSKITYSAIFILATLLTSCAKTRGCTDKTADNYDITAQQDNGKCLAARDKFLGNYTASGTIIYQPGYATTSTQGKLRISIPPIVDSLVQIEYNGLVMKGVVKANKLTILPQNYGSAMITGNGTYYKVAQQLDLKFSMTYPQGGSKYELTAQK